MTSPDMTTRSKPYTRPLRFLARFGLASALAVGITACAPTFNADVSRFQTQLPAPQGQTFAVVAEDPELAGGIEFGLYADLVAAEMTQLGYVESATPEAANLLVRFDYGVDNGRERVRSTGIAADPFFGTWGGFGRRGFRRGYAYGFYDPFLAPPEVRSYTVYVSDIDLKIDNAATGQRLFEGQAQAASRSNRLQSLVPNLVDAIFTDFPGNSGENLRITIREDGKTVRTND